PRQVYRSRALGTAKVSAADRARIPHHGLDLVDPDEPFSVADFARHADAALRRIGERRGTAILVGGTGLYLRAVGRGLALDQVPSDRALRANIDVEFEEEAVALDAGRNPGFSGGQRTWFRREPDVEWFDATGAGPFGWARERVGERLGR